MRRVRQRFEMVCARGSIGLLLASWGTAAATPSAAITPTAAIPGAVTPAAAIPGAATPGAERQRTALPLIGFVYTSQVQLGGLALVNAPAFGVATEFPRWSGAVTSLAARWRGGFEHNASFQNRWYLGGGPVFAWAPIDMVAVDFGLNASVVLLRSLWHPLHFDERAGTWEAGEGSSKFTSELGVQGGVWWRPDLPVQLGAFYGLALLYPVSPKNDLPLLPLTKLGVAAAWSLSL